QLAYSPLVAISLTSTVMRRSASAGMRTSKRSPTFSVRNTSSRRSKWIHMSLRSIKVISGTPGETYSPGSTLRWYTCEATGAYTTICAMIDCMAAMSAIAFFTFAAAIFVFLFGVAVDRLLVGRFGLIHVALAFMQG